MTDAAANDPEVADAEKIEQAEDALRTGNLAAAKRTLLEIVARAPKDYVYQYEDADGALNIKFWDQNQFLHYVTWRKSDQSVIWKQAAYPKAFYYLGFIAVKEGKPEAALDYLDRGERLEPTNPMFALEKAQALVKLLRMGEALELYDQVSEVTQYVSGHDVAVGMRGRGFVLIELGELAEARRVFIESLKLEPDSTVARNELQYIDQLLAGGGIAPMESVPTVTSDIRVCAACGEQSESGRVGNVDGRVIMICDRCYRKLTKKWWQFWK